MQEKYLNWKLREEEIDREEEERKHKVNLSSFLSTSFKLISKLFKTLFESEIAKKRQEMESLTKK